MKATGIVRRIDNLGSAVIKTLVVDGIVVISWHVDFFSYNADYYLVYLE